MLDEEERVVEERGVRMDVRRENEEFMTIPVEHYK
jgi:hypothetical protein